MLICFLSVDQFLDNVFCYNVSYGVSGASPSEQQAVHMGDDSTSSIPLPNNLTS
jgi:hypothetical protein